MSNRYKSYILVSHCLLNPYSRVHILPKNYDLSNELISYLLKNKVSVIQLPCPEFTVMGYYRNPQGRQQYNNQFFKKHCEKLFEIPLLMIKEYQHCNNKLLGFIGVEGSPTCSICWRKHKKNKYNTESVNEAENANSTVYVNGVFTEIIRKKLKEFDINIPLLEAPIKSPIDSEKGKSFMLQVTKVIERNEKFKKYIPI